MEQDNIHSSWFSTLKQRVGEFTETLPKSINWKNVGTVGLAGIMLYQAACNAKPVNADTQPTANATQTLAAQAEESQEIPETPENIEEVPEENIYPTPTVEVEQREHPEVDFSFNLSNGITNDRRIDYPEGKPFYYGFVIADKIGDRDGSGAARYTSDFGGETFAQDFSVGYSKYTDRIDDWDKFNKYMTYRNKWSEKEDGKFFHLVVVVTETDSNGNSYNCFLPLDGAVGITIDGETTVYDDDIPWDNLPFEAWDLIEDGYTFINIENGEVSGRCKFSDHVQKANTTVENPVGEES